MSISSMTNVALDRKIGVTRGGQGGAALDLAAASAQGAVADQGAVTKALDVVMAYVPTEILTLYVAIVAALEGTSTLEDRLDLFYIFLVGTPVVVWTIYAGKFRAKKRKLPLSPALWPKWEMAASLIAFSAWAFALPKGPFEGGRALASVVVLVVSVALGLAALVFSPMAESPAPED